MTVDEHCAQPALVACWYHPSGSQQSAAVSSQLLVPVSGTPPVSARRDDISTITDDFLSTWLVRQSYPDLNIRTDASLTVHQPRSSSATKALRLID